MEKQNLMPRLWGEKPYYSLDYYLKQTFGEKVYRLSLNGHMTCPNRDGTIGTGGCIFCSAGGSGDFAGRAGDSVTDQIASQKKLLENKRPVSKYIAYFQAYTNTYAPVNYLERIFSEAMAPDEIVCLSVGTRPDCLGDDVVALLSALNRIKPVWVELGLQTMHEDTAARIRRGYRLSCFEDAVKRLRFEGIPVIVHTILGLPGETREDILATMHYLNTLDIQGVKLQMLHVLSGTDLGTMYEEHPFPLPDPEEYADLVITCLANLREDIVIHRLTGDGPADLLIAPKWSTSKRGELNRIHHKMKQENRWQGQDLTADERRFPPCP